MPFREKIRAKFSKNKASSGSGSPPVDLPEGYYMGRTDIEYYKPNEIPKSKYRGRVDKDHQDKLEAFSFSFGDSFGEIRRPSAALSGTFSPGGTKAFSRRTSYASNVGAQTPARSRRSSLSSDANNSFSIPSSSSESTHMRSMPAVIAQQPSLHENAEDDTDVANTGVSTRPDKQALVTKNPDSNHIENSRSSDDMPFTAEELTQAMTRATITPQITARRTSVAVA